MADRKRRRTSRGFKVVIGLLAALFVVVWWAASRGEEYVRARAEEELSSVLETTVSVESVSIGLLPFEVTALGVTVAEAGGDRPVLEVAGVELGMRWREVFGSPRRIRTIALDRPTLHLRVDESGQHNLPLPRSEASQGDGLTLDTFEIAGGRVRFQEQVVPVDLEVHELWARASGTETGDFAAALEASRVDLEVGSLPAIEWASRRPPGPAGSDFLPGDPAWTGALSLRAGWRDGTLLITEALLKEPDLQLSLRDGFFRTSDAAWGGDVSLAGDLSLVAAAADDGAELEGEWRFDGTVSGQTAWRIEGSLTSPQPRWKGRPVENLEAEVEADPEGLRVTSLAATAASSELEGTVSVNWAQPDSPVELEIEATAGSLGQALEWLGLDLPGMSGDWSGELTWTFPAADPFAGQGKAVASIAVDGEFGESLTDQRFAVEIDGPDVEFSVPGDEGEGDPLSVTGSWSLADRRGRVDYALATSRLAEWLELIASDLDPEARQWLPVGGEGELSGVVEVEGEAWVSPLSVELREVTVGSVAAASLSASGRLDSEGFSALRLDVERPDGSILATGEVFFSGSEAALGLALDIDVAGWPAEELAAQLGLPEGLEGPVHASARVTGTTETPLAEARLTAFPGLLAGLPLSDATGAIALEVDGVRFDDLEAQLAGGSVNLNGWMPLESGEFDLEVTSTPISLALPPLTDLVPEGTRGSLSIAGSLGGTLDVPRLLLDLETEGLEVAGIESEDDLAADLRIRWADGRLTAEGGVGDLLTIDGGGPLDLESADLRVGFATERLDILAADVEGGLEGELLVLGNPSDGDLETQFVVDRLDLAYRGRRLSALEPVLLGWRQGALEIDSFFLGDEETGSEIFVFGRAPLDDSSPLAVRIQASIDTRWLELALPDWEFRNGRFDGMATIAGLASEPLVNGQGEIFQERLAVEGLPYGTEDLRAVLLFYPGQVVVDDGVARVAGGQVRAAGDVSLYADGGVEYRFQLSASDLQLRYPENWQVRAGGDLVVSSVNGGREVGGQLEIERASFSKDVDLGITQLMQIAFARRPELVDETSELMATTTLNVAVKGDDSLRVRNNVGELRGGLDLIVRGSMARPVVFGDVNLAAGSTIEFSGTEYEVQRAELHFVNPYRLEPVVDLLATTQIREYDVSLSLSGALEQLEVNFASNPPLSDLDVLRLLTGGDDPTLDTVDGTERLDAGSFLYGQAASMVAGRVNDLFGLDQVKIDPLTGASGDLSSARVTVGKRISRDLFATYSYDPSDNEQQVLEVEWQVDRQWTLVLTQNGDRSYIVDARWEKSF